MRVTTQLAIFITYFISFTIHTVVSSSLRRFYVDEGQNFTVKCPLLDTHRKGVTVVRNLTQVKSGAKWKVVDSSGQVRDADGAVDERWLEYKVIEPEVEWVREDAKTNMLHVQSDGSIFLNDATNDDSGIYRCRLANVVDNEENERNGRLELIVRTPPPPLVDVEVEPSTILALILWKVNGTGGYPIVYFSAQYRLYDANQSWIDITPIHIPPNARQVDVYKLLPNTTYEFRVWAVNQLGDSIPVEATAQTRTINETDRISSFDTRIWILAVGIFITALILFGFGTGSLFYQECYYPHIKTDDEAIELVPNITLNPGYDPDVSQRDRNIPQPDENSNNETATRLNNNSVVYPMR